MSYDSNPLRGATVGCRMGRAHARAMADLAAYELVAVCDLDRETAQRVAEQTGGPSVYTDFDSMLKEVRPEVVGIATPSASHAMLTIQAVEAGVKGVYCEKPMATCLADARAMVAVCRQNGAALVINHQRRMSAPFCMMRYLIAEGAVGEVVLIRGTCGGDILSDGTHTVDTIFHLAGDIEVKWVLGQVYRETPNPETERSEGYQVSGGWRYGHPVETGAMATFEFENGIRGEMLTGEVRFPGRGYQDIEVFGTRGRLWRPGDKGDPELLIQDDRSGGWREVPMADASGPDASSAIPDAYGAFAHTVCEGAYHPLCGDNALRGFGVVMGVYESARLRTKVGLPLTQPRFPLEMMVGTDSP